MKDQNRDKLFCDFDERGLAVFAQIIDKQTIKGLLESLSKLEKSAAVNRKNNVVYGVRNLLNLAPEIKEFAESCKIKDLVESIIGKKANIIRAIFFDKTPEANWKVPWHQDLTIAVQEKIEVAGFANWTRKAEIWHTQPPVSILENILTLRIHLDDADETNGALKVIPKSHKHGRLNAAEIRKLRQTNEINLCCLKEGDALLMRPLLIHSSSAGTNPKNRRVIHLEFSAETLPDGLKFYGS